MFKFVATVFAAILAVAFAAPNPEPKPGVVSYGAPLAYSAPIAYSAPVAYAAPSVVSGVAHAPLAYSAYSAYGAPAVYV